ncbi:DNA primase [Bacillus phage Evoli]|uniref:DNA primase n=2 Tax=Bastillevirus evoli TaxID=2560330 RepID=A0A024B080_9CAUD|nr:DNA primase [Bacillus phage Evoli]AHZ09845.1 DNA primase [Bacillus phage Evoli]AMW61874.1 DNA primase [Bacillus phage Vinny]
MFIDLLEQELGDSKPASGGEIRFNCPFCGNEKYKFYVDESPKGGWQCKRCGESGYPIAFVMKLYGVDYKEAKDILEVYDYHVGDYNGENMSHSKYGAHLTEEEQVLLFIANQGDVIHEEQDKHVKLTCPRPPTNCKSLLENFNNPEAFPFLTYLHGRGVTLEQIKHHNICYVTDGVSTLTNGKELRLINHLVFFAFDNNGKAVYWNTRSIEPKPFLKSLNAPAKPTEYSKATVVMNLNRARHKDKIVIVEGFFNMITIGNEAVVTYGKQVSKSQIEKILKDTKTKQPPIYIYLDRDGWEEAIKVATKIHEVDSNRAVYYVYNEDDRDPNELGYEEAWNRINNAIPADTEGETIWRTLHLL